MLLELQKVDLSTAAAQAADATFLGQTKITEADGVQVVVRPGEWSQFTSAGFGLQASTSRASAGAGVRHVCTSIAAVFSTGATAQATAVDLNLRDGGTGAGTILWSQRFILDVNKTLQFNLSGLNIVGSPNTAMTLEFNAAGVAGSVESVAMVGYDAA